MHDERTPQEGPLAARNATAIPAVVERDDFQAQVDELRVREKAHTREGDAIAAARRRLPMVEVDANTPLVGPDGPTTLLDAFEGRRQLLGYFWMWHNGLPAADQCPGCTWDNAHLTELSYLHSRDITYAVLAQGPYDESRRYRDFMGWDMAWYSAEDSLETLLVGRRIGQMYLISYLRDGDRVYETYWTTFRGVEAMEASYSMMDLTVYGRQEPAEESPDGWPKPWTQNGGTSLMLDGRPIPQWQRLKAGRSDSLTP
jgi:predicted dithiol-disulfide oxidoreductase (DUF899 family)